MRTPLEMAQISEIMAHVSTIFEHYGEDDEYYDEYLSSILNNDINKALLCFRDLKKSIGTITLTSYSDKRMIK